MKNYALTIGIDISKLKLDIVGINSESETILQHQIIENSKPKINLFLKKIIKKYGTENILVTF
jgi:predicted NBD/HSP70 family sugar kinase